MATKAQAKGYRFELHGVKELMESLDQLPTVAMKRTVVRNALKNAGKPIVDLARANCPMGPTGNLARSIQVSTRLKRSQQRGRTKDSKTVEVFVGSSARHCIFGGRKSRITTKNGHKSISEIKIGDEVLTQTGEFKKITGINSFYAQEKPDLVTITAFSRNKGKIKTHKLTVTEDHKIMVFRDGRNKWVEAGELLISDKLYVRKKLAHNKNSGVTIKCKYCGKEKRTDGQFGRHRKYCDIKCRNMAFSGNLNPHIGAVRSSESRNKMSLAIKKRLQENPETHPNKIMAQKGYQTDCEKQLEEWLNKQNINYEKQFQIGRHFVDYYLPNEKIAYEADGAFWHKNQAKDIVRDGEIKEAMPDLSIIHVHFYDKRFSPILDLSPLPGVYYIPCNPGLSTFTNPELFETTDIIKIKKFRYGTEIKPRGQPKAKLYDLMVEDVHSFFANGLLISNSHLVEFGTVERTLEKPRKVQLGGHWVEIKTTGQMPARPFLRNAWDSMKYAALKIFTTEMRNELYNAARKLAQKAERGTLGKAQIRGLLR